MSPIHVTYYSYKYMTKHIEIAIYITTFTFTANFLKL